MSYLLRMRRNLHYEYVICTIGPLTREDHSNVGTRFCMLKPPRDQSASMADAQNSHGSGDQLEFQAKVVNGEAPFQAKVFLLERNTSFLIFFGAPAPAPKSCVSITSTAMDQVGSDLEFLAGKPDHHSARVSLWTPSWAGPVPQLPNALGFQPEELEACGAGVWRVAVRDGPTWTVCDGSQAGAAEVER